MLCSLLGIKDKRWAKNEYVQRNINPFIMGASKKRLVEAPSDELKRIQSKIKTGLSKCHFPNFVYSGIKGKSYVDNAKEHQGRKYVYKIDISAFFPNTPRDRVYQFYRYQLNTSPDVAEMLTNFSTSDLDRDYSTKSSVEKFIIGKGIRYNNHLCTGSPASPLLSFLVNQPMFEEMLSLCKSRNICMTVYVDDVFFSSEYRIDDYFRRRIVEIVAKYGYKISPKKVRYYNKCETKKVTGVIIREDGTTAIPNRLQRKVVDHVNSSSNEDVKTLRGCVVAARQIDPAAFPSIIGSLKEKGLMR